MQDGTYWYRERHVNSATGSSVWGRWEVVRIATDPNSRRKKKRVMIGFFFRFPFVESESAEFQLIEPPKP